MKPIRRSAFIGICFTFTLFSSMPAQAASGKSPVPASTKPSDNRCWGEIASGLAQFDSPNVTDAHKGGAMGLHSRSGTAADKNGGFANSSNPFAFDQPREGVGNVSGDAPHFTHPGDGGNGQHAVNNGEVLATLVDPATGTPMGGAGEPIECSQDVEPNLPF